MNTKKGGRLRKRGSKTASKAVAKEAAKETPKVAPKKTSKEVPKKVMRRERKRGILSATLIALIIATMGILMGWMIWQKVTAAEQAKKEVPRLEIFLSDTTMETIYAGGKADRYDVDVVTLTAGDKTEVFEGIEMHGRGNSTWSQAKRPFQIKLAFKEDLLGLGKARKWVLLANYFDASYLRNAVAFKIEEMLGEKFALDGEFVELYVDGNYYGLYYMTHKISIGKEAVDLREPLGVVMEIDNLHKDDKGEFSSDGNYLMIKDVVNDDLENEALADFMISWNALEKAVRNKDWAAVRNLADVESFAQYYILSELTNNPDAYQSSCYFYKDGTEDVIHSGPGWDFDLAFGNQVWTINGEMFLSPTRLDALENHYEGQTLFSRLMKIPEFEALVVRIWQTRMAGRGEELMNYIKSQAEYIREAAIKDTKRWKLGGFDEGVDYLEDWIWQRYRYMGEMFDEKATTSESMSVEVLDFLKQITD